jgi:ferritin-like metal-binding protein YciE
MADIKNLNDLYVHLLRDIYYAEKQIEKALPKMAKKADNSELKAAFEEHLNETKNQIKRLEKVFELSGKKASGETCPAIEGILEEAEELMGDVTDAATLDAAMIAAAQAVEHYEITRYGTILTYADQLGMGEAVDILRETLAEEENADKKLTVLAKASVNPQAA